MSDRLLLGDRVRVNQQSGAGDLAGLVAAIAALVDRVARGGKATPLEAPRRDAEVQPLDEPPEPSQTLRTLKGEEL